MLWKNENKEDKLAVIVLSWIFALYLLLTKFDNDYIDFKVKLNFGPIFKANGWNLSCRVIYYWFITNLNS